MLSRSLLVVCLTSAVCAAQAAPAPPEGPRRIRLAPQLPAKRVAAFRYRLLPDPRDIKRGNAGPLWNLAGDAARGASRKLTNKQFDWMGKTPLNHLPIQEVHDFLKQYTAALHLARQAACREHCDWELPPVTFQSIEEFLPHAHREGARELAVLLGIQYRLELAERRFDDASETLQTGFALARHLCEGDMLIDFLVGMAIDAIMCGHVEEWIQTPGSPNLYWALTALPLPRANLRHSIEHEMNSLYRSFPKLHRLHREKLTAREAENLVKEVFDEVFGFMMKFMSQLPKEAEYLKKQIAELREAKMYAQARKQLIELGRSAKEVDAMPKVQVCLLWYFEQYDQLWDDAAKALTLPTWQALPLLEASEAGYKANRPSNNVFLTLLFPAYSKVLSATVRFERQLAGLRCAEALRLYAAKHGGKPPAKWRDITEVPLPIDPLTGKGLDDFYQVKDGRGILEIPPPPPFYSPFLGRRYELAPTQ